MFSSEFLITFWSIIFSALLTVGVCVSPLIFIYVAIASFSFNLKKLGFLCLIISVLLLVVSFLVITGKLYFGKYTFWFGLPAIFVLAVLTVIVIAFESLSFVLIHAKEAVILGLLVIIVVVIILRRKVKESEAGAGCR